MKIDFDVIRWRFLVFFFLILFFFIGAFRYSVKKYKQYKFNQSFEFSGVYPSGSLGSQVQDALKRAKRLEKKNM